MATAVLVGTSLVACASSPKLPVRASTVPEAKRATETLVPLLRELGYRLTGSSAPTFQDGCKVGFVVVPTASINAGARPGTAAPCVHFTMFITEGALAGLPVAQLRGIMAHELGHVHLGHFLQRQGRAETGGAANWWLFRRAYDHDEELAADDFAVRLLLGLEDRYSGSCAALVSIFERLARQQGQASDWFSTHPAPERRAERTKVACERLRR